MYMHVKLKAWPMSSMRYKVAGEKNAGTDGLGKLNVHLR